MSDSKGRFVWYELMTTDTGAAKEFYGEVVGWGSEDVQMPGMTYTLLKAGEKQVGGLMALPENARKAGAHPSWTGYVAVDDVDAATERVKQLGGTVHVPPTEIPNVGRFSLVADPQKATLALFKGNTAEYQPTEPEMPGGVGWHELLAVDWQKALAFYGELFGWKKSDAVDMGGMGTYQLFSTNGQAIGGMFNKPPIVPAPFWLYYFNVGDIDAAATRVKESGGQIVSGPMEVPGGGWIVHGTDPQGAMFALFGKRA